VTEVTRGERLRTSLHEYTRLRQQPVRTILQRGYERVIVDLMMGAWAGQAPRTPRGAADSETF